MKKKDRRLLSVDRELARRALFPDREYHPFDMSDREMQAARRVTELLAKLQRLYAQNGDPGGGWPELLHDLLAAARDLGHAEAWRQRGQVAFAELEGLDEFSSLEGTARRRKDKEIGR